MKRILAVLAAIAIGCAPAPRSSTTTAHDGVYTPRPTDLEGKTWKLRLPIRWEVVTVDKNDTQTKDDITIEALAQSTTTYGRGPAVVVLASVDLTEKTEIEDGTFGKRYASVIIADKGNIVFNIKPIIFDNRPAELVFYINKNNIANITIITDKARRGYVLKCAGDADHITKVTSACVEVLKTFKLK